MLELALTVANAAGGIIAGFLTFAIWEALRLLTGHKVDEEVAALRRRLADVQALRRAEQGKLPPIIGEHLGDRPICEETEGDCS